MNNKRLSKAQRKQHKQARMMRTMARGKAWVTSCPVESSTQWVATPTDTRGTQV